jgi:hypothetical protein
MSHLARDRRSAKQGPRSRGCDGGADHGRLIADPMRVFGVRSPEGPLFRTMTRPIGDRQNDECRPLAARDSKIGKNFEEAAA